MILTSLFQGTSVLLVVLAVYAISLSRGQGELDARALGFTTLIIANLGLILTNRSWSNTILTMLQVPNQALWWVVVGAAAVLGLVLYVPFLNQLFSFDALHLDDIIICLSAGIVSIVAFECLKLVAPARPTARHSTG